MKHKYAVGLKLDDGAHDRCHSLEEAVLHDLPIYALQDLRSQVRDSVRRRARQLNLLTCQVDKEGNVVSYEAMPVGEVIRLMQDLGVAI